MSFDKALYIFNLDTLIGETEQSLTKKKRQLIKENHPDANKPCRFTVSEILEAYDLLTANVNGLNLKTVLDSYEYMVHRRKKHKKVIDYGEFVKSLDIKNRKVLDLDEEYLLYVSFPFHFKHYRGDDLLEDIVRDYEFKYEKSNEYAIELSLSYEFGDRLEIEFNSGEKVLEGKLNSAQNMLLMSLELNILDTLKFVINVVQ